MSRTGKGLINLTTRAAKSREESVPEILAGAELQYLVNLRTQEIGKSILS